MTVRRSDRRARLAGLLWLLPALILVVGIVHVGIVYNGVISTTDWNGIAPTWRSIGLDNYTAIIEDDVFLAAMRNTAVYAVAVTVLQLGAGLGVAVLVRTQARGRNLLRVLIFVPVVLSPAIIGTTARYLLDQEGALNDVLRAVGMDGLARPWLADSTFALATLVAITVWQYTGYSFVIYDAAISQVDPATLEAAQIDGASNRRTFTAVVLPNLRGAHLVLIVLTAISSLKTFDLVVLTTAGGPGTSTELLTLHIYEQTILRFHAGYGAALSLVLVAIALVFAVLQVRLSRLREV
ncbi:carbohydrate ABC transporter permease [Jiangella asiatica]|uniref:Sugar ABC transporter permease n=1 Tax=Jiangella asiatica TaxID=2530372 RepID=A0A4R5DHC2_9ACTN|nr:sugar ABC transporter permease [Jiangella asiatica]TDE09883.1 sugar ABC transporter permease [Jiangella asiatica]